MSVTLQITKSNVAVLVLSRVEKRNAFNSEVIHELIQCIEHANTLDIRALVLKTEGKHFSAGAERHGLHAKDPFIKTHSGTYI